MEHYEQTYVEFATLDELTLDEDNELSIEGFHKRYQAWITDKQSYFERKIVQIEEEKRIYIEKVKLRDQEQEQLYKEQQKRLNTVMNKSCTLDMERESLQKQKIIRRTSLKTYDEHREEILHMMSQ